MHHSQSDSKPSLQKGGKPASGPVGASILASVDGKAGRHRATVKQSSASQSQRRVWVWALPLVLGAVAAGGLVWWLQQPAEQVASAPLAADLSADRSVDQAAFVADGNAVNASAHTDPAPEQTFTPDSSREQGAHIEDTGTLTAGASPFTALQAKANVPAEIASPFQALNEADKPKGVAVLQSPSAPRTAPTQAGQAAGGRAQAHQPPKQAARAPAVVSEQPSQPLASGTGSAASARSGTVLARTEPSRTELLPKRVALATHEAQSTTGASTPVASVSSAISASIPARSPVESPAAANTVAAVKPAVTTIAASAAQAAASAAVAEMPTALGSGDPLNSLLKAAGHAAAAVTAQGVSRLTRAETPQQTSAAGQSDAGEGKAAPVSAPAPGSPATERQPVAPEKKASTENRPADAVQADNAQAKSKKSNNKPEKAKAPDPDVTLMRALMRHLETPSK